VDLLPARLARAVVKTKRFHHKGTKDTKKTQAKDKRESKRQNGIRSILACVFLVSLRIKAAASGQLRTCSPALSQVSFLPTRKATLPSKAVSVSGPAQLKLLPAGGPPLQAAIQAA